MENGLRIFKRLTLSGSDQEGVLFFLFRNNQILKGKTSTKITDIL